MAGDPTECAGRPHQPSGEPCAQLPAAGAVAVRARRNASRPGGSTLPPYTPPMKNTCELRSKAECSLKESRT